MQAVEFNQRPMAPNRSLSSAVADFFFDEVDSDSHRVALPRPELQIIVRFGPSTPGGLDVHAFGLQQSVRRKLIRGGQRSVTARLHLGAARAVLGVPASVISGCVVALDELWGRAAVQRLLDRINGVSNPSEAVTIVASAIAERVALAQTRNAHADFVLSAAEKLMSANVDAVAHELGVSERHLRRVFRESVGLGPKEFARLARFRRALQLAREEGCLNWAAIAATTGYYDQAHLIEEFRSIAGTTPRALLSELDAKGLLSERAAAPADAAGNSLTHEARSYDVGMSSRLQSNAASGAGRCHDNPESRLETACYVRYRRLPHSGAHKNVIHRFVVNSCV